LVTKANKVIRTFSGHYRN